MRPRKPIRHLYDSPMDANARPHPSFATKGAVLGALAAAWVGGAANAQSVPEPTGSAAPAVQGDVLARPAPSVDELLKRLETLEDRNRELEQKVTDLNRAQGEEWLGEQRASQIREIVHDVLADSQQRASLQDGGVMAGWNDGFFMASNDGRFRMELGGFMQARFIWSHIQPGNFVAPGANASNTLVGDRLADRYAFDMPNVQLWANGHVFSRDFTYMVKARFYQQVATDFQKGASAVPGNVDFSGFELLDAWARINLDDNWSMRAGQYRTPFSRGFLTLEQYQMSASRSVVDYHYALGYTQGLELEYGNEEFRGRFSVNNGELDQLMGDAYAVYSNGSFYKLYPTGSYGGQNAPWWEQNTQLSLTSRLEWKPMGSWNQFRSQTSPAGEPLAMLFGLGLHWQESSAYQSNTASPNQDDPLNQWFAATIDGQVNFGGASLYGSVFYNYVSSAGGVITQYGSNVNSTFNLGDISIVAAQFQGAVYLMPKVELFGRYEFAYIGGVDNGTLAANNVPRLENPSPMNLLTAGVNWYLDGQDVKWTTDMGVALTDFHPWFADMEAGWRPSNAGEFVFRTQLQLMF